MIIHNICKTSAQSELKKTIQVIAKNYIDGFMDYQSFDKTWEQWIDRIDQSILSRNEDLAISVISAFENYALKELKKFKDRQDMMEQLTMKF